MLRVWDPRTGAARGQLADHRGFVSTVAYSPDGRLLASASSDSTVRIWDLPARAYASVLDEFDGWWVEGMAFSPDGQYLASGGHNSESVWILEASGRREHREHREHDGDALLNQQLAQEYGRACSAVMAAAQAALPLANAASGAWNKAEERPQHEISIRTFTSFAQGKEAEFTPLLRAFQAAVDAARAAGAKLSSQFSDPDQAELCLALALDQEAYSEVDAAIQFLRVNVPPDARGFRDLIPSVNHAINTTPAFGEPGFPGNIYRYSP